MAEPSNIRVNPFTGTGGATNYVELTEKHIIPAVSPYVIRLNEVPEKQDPSNMKMVYVDSATGAATENALTEVAATPSQGEFRPDYSTNAMEDKTWNTGLIEFSASDAGKIVQVTYTGTGTLAAVNTNHWPSWYTDRGDGSDGDFVPTEDTTISGVKNYKSVFIKSGITVTIDKYALIKCQGAFVNKGTITANGKGASGGNAISKVSANGENGDNGLVSQGGAGGNGYSTPVYTGGTGGARFVDNVYVNEETANSLAIYDCFALSVGSGGGSGASAHEDILTGSSFKSGAGGNGGGAIKIACTGFNNIGTISANGENGGNATYRGCGGGGGGGGGSIVIVCYSNIKRGTLTATGGTGGKKSPNYGGADGSNGTQGIINVIELGV